MSLKVKDLSSCYYYKDLISFIYPSLHTSNQSRFVKLFMEEKQIKLKKSFHIDINNIHNGTDVRTSIMIKNISRNLPIYDIERTICSFCKVDYVHIPINVKNSYSLGFAFVNCISPVEIETLINTLRDPTKSELIKGVKNIEICYSKIQGKQELQNAFGEKTHFLNYH